MEEITFREYPVFGARAVSPTNSARYADADNSSNNSWQRAMRSAKVTIPSAAALRLSST